MANMTQLELPYSNLYISSNATSVNGYYDDYNWLGDGIDNTISGSITSLSLTPDDTWLKIGFGDLSSAGGWLVFYADNSGGRHAYLQYADGSVNSAEVDLASFGLGPLYSFEITANEATGSFDATITDFSDTHTLTGYNNNDLTGALNRVFVAGVSEGGTDTKIYVDSTLNVGMLSTPAPAALGLCVFGIGLVGWLRRRQTV